MLKLLGNTSQEKKPLTSWEKLRNFYMKEHEENLKFFEVLDKKIEGERRRCTLLVSWTNEKNEVDMYDIFKSLWVEKNCFEYFSRDFFWEVYDTGWKALNNYEIGQFLERIKQYEINQMANKSKFYYHKDYHEYIHFLYPGKLFSGSEIFEGHSGRVDQEYIKDFIKLLPKDVEKKFTEGQILPENFPHFESPMQITLKDGEEIKLVVDRRENLLLMTDLFNRNIYNFGRELYTNYITSLRKNYKKRVISLLDFQTPKINQAIWMTQYSDFVNKKVKFLLLREFIFDMREWEKSRVQVSSGSDFSFWLYNIENSLLIDSIDLEKLFEKVENKLGKGYREIYIDFVKSVLSKQRKEKLFDMILKSAGIWLESWEDSKKERINKNFLYLRKIGFYERVIEIFQECWGEEKVKNLDINITSSEFLYYLLRDIKSPSLKNLFKYKGWELQKIDKNEILNLSETDKFTLLLESPINLDTREAITSLLQSKHKEDLQFIFSKLPNDKRLEEFYKWVKFLCELSTFFEREKKENPPFIQYGKLLKTTLVWGMVSWDICITKSEESYNSVLHNLLGVDIVDMNYCSLQWVEYEMEAIFWKASTSIFQNHIKAIYKEYNEENLLDFVIKCWGKASDYDRGKQKQIEKNFMYLKSIWFYNEILTILKKPEYKTQKQIIIKNFRWDIYRSKFIYSLWRDLHYPEIWEKRFVKSTGRALFETFLESPINKEKQRQFSALMKYGSKFWNTFEDFHQDERVKQFYKKIYSLYSISKDSDEYKENKQFIEYANEVRNHLSNVVYERAITPESIDEAPFAFLEIDTDSLYDKDLKKCSDQLSEFYGEKIVPIFEKCIFNAYNSYNEETLSNILWKCWIQQPEREKRKSQQRENNLLYVKGIYNEKQWILFNNKLKLIFNKNPEMEEKVKSDMYGSYLLLFLFTTKHNQELRDLFHNKYNSRKPIIKQDILDLSDHSIFELFLTSPINPDIHKVFTSIIKWWGKKRLRKVFEENQGDKKIWDFYRKVESLSWLPTSYVSEKEKNGALKEYAWLLKKHFFSKVKVLPKSLDSWVFETFNINIPRNIPNLEKISREVSRSFGKEYHERFLRLLREKYDSLEDKELLEMILKCGKNDGFSYENDGYKQVEENFFFLKKIWFYKKVIHILVVNYILGNKKEPVKKLVKKVKNDSSYSKFLSQLIQDPLYALSYTQAV